MEKRSRCDKVKDLFEIWSDQESILITGSVRLHSGTTCWIDLYTALFFNGILLFNRRISKNIGASFDF